MTRRFIDGVRTVRRAGLLAFGLVDTPAYHGSTVEARVPSRFAKTVTGSKGAFFYDVDTVISDRAEVGERESRRGNVRPASSGSLLVRSSSPSALLIGRFSYSPGALQ